MNDTEDIIADFFAQVDRVLGHEALPHLAKTKIEQALRSTWGGQPVYVKKAACAQKAIRLRDEFNGRNRVELQQKYGISKSQFYRLLKGG